MNPADQKDQFIGLFSAGKKNSDAFEMKKKRIIEMKEKEKGGKK